MHVTAVVVLEVTEITFQQSPDDAWPIQSPTTTSRPLYLKSSLVRWEPCNCSVTVNVTVH